MKDEPAPGLASPLLTNERANYSDFLQNSSAQTGRAPPHVCAVRHSFQSKFLKNQTSLYFPRGRL